MGYSVMIIDDLHDNVDIEDIDYENYNYKSLYMTYNYVTLFREYKIYPRNFNYMKVKDIIPFYMNAKDKLESKGIISTLMTCNPDSKWISD